MFSTSLAIVGHYFHARQGLALGVVMAGAALGGVIFPIVLNRLLNSVGLSFGCKCLQPSAHFSYASRSMDEIDYDLGLMLELVLNINDQDLNFTRKAC